MQVDARLHLRRRERVNEGKESQARKSRLGMNWRRNLTNGSGAGRARSADNVGVSHARNQSMEEGFGGRRLGPRGRMRTLVNLRPLRRWLLFRERRGKRSFGEAVGGERFGTASRHSRGVDLWRTVGSRFETFSRCYCGQG